MIDIIKQRAILTLFHAVTNRTEENMTPQEVQEKPLLALRDFFNTTLQEFQAFWKGLTEPEKTQYKAEILKWDGASEFVH